MSPKRQKILTFISLLASAAFLLFGNLKTVSAIDGLMNGKTATGYSEDYVFWLQTYDPETAPFYFDKFYVGKNGNVGIGKTNPGYMLDINGAVNATAVLVNGVAVGSGGSQWVSGSGGAIYYTGGNVGVGITNPTAKLDDLGSFKNSLTVTHSAFGGAGDVLIMADNNGVLYSTSTAAFLGGSGTNFWGGTKNANIWNGDAGAGNVGIGTTNPQSNLDVSSNSPIIRLTDTDGGYHIFGGNAGILDLSVDAGNSVANSRFQISVDGSEKFRLDSSGNVGVGTTSPGAKLDVAGVSSGSAFKVGAGVSGWTSQYVNVDEYGTLKIAGRTDVGNNLLFGAIATSGDTYARFGFGFDTGVPFVGFGPGTAVRDIFLRRESGDLTFTFGSSPSEKVRITSSGNVGIGTTAPSSKLTIDSGALEIIGSSAGFVSNKARIYGSSGSMQITGTSVYIADGAGGQRIQMMSDGKILLNPAGGNVGIGKTDPGANLDVLTNINAGSSINGMSLCIAGDCKTAWSQVSGNSGGWTTDSSTKTTTTYNVGIGTTTPSNPLQVQVGAAGRAFRVYSVSDYPAISGTSGDLFVGAVQFMGTVIPWSDISIALGSSGRRWSSFYSKQITDNGTNIGIGTSNPVSILHVSDANASNNTVLTLDSPVTGRAAFLSFKANGSQYATTFGLAGAASQIFAETAAGDFAIRAANNQKLYLGIDNGSGNASPIVTLNSGNVGINKTNPDAKLDIVGNINSNSTVNGTGLCIAGDCRVSWPAVVAAGGGNLWSGTTTGAIYNANSGNVGIGTTNPEYKLDLQTTSGVTSFFRMYGNNVSSADGSFSITNYTSTAGYFAPIFLGKGNSNSFPALTFISNTDAPDSGNLPMMRFQARQGNGTVANRILFSFENGYAVGAEKMVILANGNVGISTTTPSAKLQVQGTSYLNGQITTNLSGSGSRCVYVDASGNLLAKTTDCGTATGGDNLGDHTATQNIKLGNYWLSGDGGNEGVFVKSDGNVGIGTTVPNGKLNVSNIGAEGIEFWPGFSSNLNIIQSYNRSTSAYNDLQINTKSGGSVLIQATTGNVGVDTNAPGAKLEIKSDQAVGLSIDSNYAAANHWALRADTNGVNYSGLWEDTDDIFLLLRDNVGNVDVNLRADGASYLNGGNVGINKTNPGVALDVFGSGAFSANLSAVGGTFSVLSGGGPRLVMADNSGNLYATSTSVATGIPSAAGISGYTLRSDGSSWVSNNTLFNNGTNVGIGTTNPIHKLQISAGNLSLSDGYAIDWGNGSTRITSLQPDGNNRHMGFQTWNNSTGLGERMRITSTGNVGINKTNPEATLDVAGNINSSSTINGTGLCIGGDCKSSWPEIGAASSGWTQNGTEVYKTNTNGNVGIGITAPVQKLDVSGVINAATGYRVANAVASTGTYLRGNGTNFVASGIQTSDVPTLNQDTSGYAGTLSAEDNRVISPSELAASRMKFGFTSYANNNTYPYADFIHLRSYIDGSGGSDNLLVFNKSGFGMRLYQQTYGSATAYSSYKDVLLSDTSPVVNYLTKYTNTGATVSAGKSVVYDNGTNVGIGKTDPGANLDVLTNINAGSSINGTSLCIAGDCKTAWSQVAGTNFWGGTKNGNIWNGDAGAGNVGIGTTVPGTKLDVSGTGRVSSDLSIGGWGYVSKIYPYSSSDDFYIETNTGKNIYFKPAGSETVRFTSGGNVGIGTTTPSAKLQVQGTSYLNGQVTTSLSGSGNRCVYVDASGNLLAKSVDCGTATGGDNLGDHTATQNIKLGNYWLSGDGGNEGVFVKSDGNVGIGTTAPGEKLTILQNGNYQLKLQNDNTGGGNVRIAYTDNSFGAGGNKLIFDLDNGGSANSEMVVQSNGNVGINTTAPGVRLDVSGYFRATGATLSAIGAGYVAADSSGNLYSTSTPSFLGAYLPLSGGTMTGAINMGGQNISNANSISVNKLTATTIDPLYKIKGINYSTFAPSVVGGVKEEYVGKIRITHSVGQEYEARVDFSSVAEGSDLWVWRQVVEFNHENVEVLVTPYGTAAQVYYFISGENLIFRSDKPVEISYRLIGKRFDWRIWPTKAADQSEQGYEVKVNN